MTARELFKRTEAVLEYRPVSTQDGGWDWYWVLLPLPAEDVAIASGTEATRGEASLQARKEARKAGRRITKVRTHHHKLSEPPEESSSGGKSEFEVYLESLEKDFSAREYVMSTPRETKLLPTLWQPAQRNDGIWAMVRYCAEGFPFRPDDPKGYEAARGPTEQACIEAFRSSKEYKKYRPRESVVGGSFRGEFPWEV